MTLLSMTLSDPRHLNRTLFLNFGSSIISSEPVKLDTSNLEHILIVAIISIHDRLLSNRMCSGSRDLFKFRKISDNISETVRDGDVVTADHSKTVIFAYRMTFKPWFRATLKFFEIILF